MSREDNRAAMPLFSEVVDMIRASHPEARVLWVKEGGVEKGKRPPLEPHLFEIGPSTVQALREKAAVERARKK